MLRVPPKPAPERLPRAALAAALLLGACGSLRVGPELAIVNPEGHRIFLDGVELERVSTRRPAPKRRAGEPPVAATAPDGDRFVGTFRYYGTTRVLALPAPRLEHGIPEFDRSPTRIDVEIAPPASAWLFPLDLPLESLDRLFAGRRDQTVTVQVPTRTARELAGSDIPQAELGLLSDRARAARSGR